MKKTLRLIIPQWQGGNNPNYAFGADLLAWLAPESENSKTIEVPVDRNYNKKLEKENNILGESILLEQLQNTKKILEEHQPEKIIIFGGDCSIDQAPFDYLNGRYGEKLGILWLDAHPDISTPKDLDRDHAMVLGNLLGEGAPNFADKIDTPLKPNQVMFAGLQKMLPHEEESVKRLGINHVGPSALVENSQSIIDWIQENEFDYLAVHFDLDVLSPKDFRDILPAEPYLEEFEAAVGDMTLAQVVRVLKDVSNHSEIVGLGIAEYMPWDAINLRNALSEIAIFND